jgi:hypothetical protein
MRKKVALFVSLLVGGLNLVAVTAPASATECRKQPCPPACQVNRELYIDEKGNVGWGGSGRPIDCYV